MRRLVVVALLSVLPTALAAQGGTADTTRSGGMGTRGRAVQGTQDTQDTTRGRRQGRRGRVESESRGAMHMRSNMGLSSTQVRQLQQALADSGCYTGRVDGIAGRMTHRGIACARQKTGVQGNNLNELFRSLHLDFTVQDSLGMDMMNERGQRGGAMRRDRGDTGTARPRGTGRPPSP